MKTLKCQKGAIAIEAAYVIPLMLVAALLIIDTVVYATDRLAANNAVNNIYELVVSQAQYVSLNPTATANYVVCTNHQVLPQQGPLTALLQTSVAAVTNQNAQDIHVTSYQPDTAIVDYVVDVQFTSHTLFLPESWAQSFPVRNRMYISFDYSC